MDSKSFNQYCREKGREISFYLLPAYFADILNYDKSLNISISEGDEVKKLLGEVYQITRGIHDSLDSGNIISGVILLRTLVERTILFKILFHDKAKISENIGIYINHGYIIAYEGLSKHELTENEKIYFGKCKEIFEKESSIYKDGAKYNLYKGLLGERKSFEFLFETYIKTQWEKDNKIVDSLYILLSLMSHGCSQNIALLAENTFLPYHDIYQKREIEIFCESLLKLIGKEFNLNIY